MIQLETEKFSHTYTLSNVAGRQDYAGSHYQGRSQRALGPEFNLSFGGGGGEGLFY